MKINSVVTGFILGAGGIATLNAMDAVVKSLGASLPTLQIVFVRFAGAALWLGIFLLLTANPWPRRRNFKRHAARGMLMALTAFFFFYGVTHLPLAIAAALAMSAPIYVSFFGIVLLKEPATPALVLAILLGICGSMIIVFGGTSVVVTGSADILAWGAAILAPVCYASALVLIKHHSTDEGSAGMAFAQSVVAALIASPFAAYSYVAPTAHAWAQIALVGFLGALGFLLLISGLRKLPASVFSLIDYTGLLWAAAFGFLFFAETAELNLWIGGGLIIAACTIGMRTTKKHN